MHSEQPKLYFGRSVAVGLNDHVTMLVFRCRRVVILLSRAFLESPVCDFQLKFAQCLAPGKKTGILTLVSSVKVYKAVNPADT